MRVVKCVGRVGDELHIINISRDNGVMLKFGTKGPKDKGNGQSKYENGQWVALKNALLQRANQGEYFESVSEDNRGISLKEKMNKGCE